MNQLQIAYDHDDGGNVLRGIAYVAFQELATRISHRNTGRYSSDPVADRIMARIAADENLHMVFYRDMLSEAMLVDPSAAVHAVADEVIGFEMPGSGMVNFSRKAAQMAKAGIYDLRIHHDEVVWPLLRHWGIFEASGLDASAEARREELRRFLVELDAQASRFEAKRALTLEREAARTS
jgi:acyl-[acyl-carrier-protein] desaturase